MSDQTINGAACEETPMQKAVNAYGEALLKSRATPNGQIALPFLEIYLDGMVTQLKIEAVFEELEALGLIHPANVVGRLLSKLAAATEELKRQQSGLHLAIARGNVPRNG